MTQNKHNSNNNEETKQTAVDEIRNSVETSETELGFVEEAIPEINQDQNPEVVIVDQE